MCGQAMLVLGSGLVGDILPSLWGVGVGGALLLSLPRNSPYVWIPGSGVCARGSVRSSVRGSLQELRPRPCALSGVWWSWWAPPLSTCICCPPSCPPLRLAPRNPPHRASPSRTRGSWRSRWRSAGEKPA